jgi:hypothetical protein
MAVAAAGAEQAGKPVPVDFDSITLELRLRDGLTKGTFHPVQASVVDAEVWAGGLPARADVHGFRALPGGPVRDGKKPPPGLLQLKGATAVFVTLKPAGDGVLEIDTEAGKAKIILKDAVFGQAQKYLDGALTVRRVPSAVRLVAPGTDNDHPAAARRPGGDVWVAFVAYTSGGETDMAAAKEGRFDSFTPRGNGDQIQLIRFDGREWSAPLPVTAPRQDLWKPSVAVDGSGKVWVAWSQNVEGNWDIYRRSYDSATAQWSAVERMTTAPGSHINVVSATDAGGNVWWAWQGRRGKNFQIFLAQGTAGTSPIPLTDQPANHWDPAIAADSKGNIYVAWDSYENGNYDVFMRRVHAGQPAAVIPVATTANYETRASLAADRADRVWIAYEQGGVNWGKDFGNRKVVPKSADYRQAEGADGLGIPLYNGRRVVVKCCADEQIQSPADPATAWSSLPHPKSFARLAVAADGRLWLLFRHHPLPSALRETWAEYAMPFDGKNWGPPRMLTDSDNLLDNRPAVVSFGPDGVLAVYSGDWRLRGAQNMDGDVAGLCETISMPPGCASKARYSRPSGRPHLPLPLLLRKPPVCPSIRASRTTFNSFASSASSVPARPINWRVASFTATLSIPPIATATVPWRTCGVTPRTPPTWTGWATPTTTTASATSMPGGSSRRPPPSITTHPGSSPPLPTSAAFPIPTGTAT